MCNSVQSRAVAFSTHFSKFDLSTDNFICGIDELIRIAYSKSKNNTNYTIQIACMCV